MLTSNYFWRLGVQISARILPKLAAVCRGFPQNFQASVRIGHCLGHDCFQILSFSSFSKSSCHWMLFSLIHWQCYTINHSIEMLCCWANYHRGYVKMERVWVKEWINVFIDTVTCLWQWWFIRCRIFILSIVWGTFNIHIAFRLHFQIFAWLFTDVLLLFSFSVWAALVRTEPKTLCILNLYLSGPRNSTYLAI